MVATGEFQSLVPAEKDLKTRMDELIQKAPFMIFIKGSPETPRCGFSKYVCVDSTRMCFQRDVCA